MSSDPWGDLAASLATVCESFSRSLRAHRGFLAGSPAAREAAVETYADDWAARPARNANMAAMHLAVVAMDHLAGLSTLLRRDSSSLYAPSAVARSTLEVAARAYYLLDPDAEPLERIRRHHNEVLVSLAEKKRLAEVAAGANEDPEALRRTVESIDARMDSIFRSARRFGLVVHPKEHTPFLGTRGRSKPPSATRLVEAALGGDSRLGAFFYQSMSAVTHGREHGMMQAFSHGGALSDRTHGDAYGRLEMSVQQAAEHLAGAPLVVRGMLDRLYARYGWPPESIGGTLRSMLLTWGGIARMHAGDTELS
jgi:hypothetical protein